MKKIIGAVALVISNSTYAEEWNFDAVLNDKVIGQHTFIYENEKTISNANFKFEYLFMDFIYQHKSTETWQEGCLKTISSKTDDDGDLYEVSGHIGTDRFLVTTNNKTSELPSCVMTFAYGNPKILEQKKLMNSQSGEYLDVDIQFIREENHIVKGEDILTDLWRIEANIDDGDLLIHLWYDKNMNWVSLKSQTPIGDMLYKLK
ncbi:DUF6134 family protein [Methylophilaceae bacterium]|jgi:hypothetical protein|nr:DUF6134 family protein [Methylophilaceae bacterium]|tara:strand:+ start:58 stop:669 length:612 start_codon:yes stop_codon:yes gene_type:complete